MPKPRKSERRDLKKPVRAVRGSGHKRGTAGIYNRSPYTREVNDAMLRWSDHISALIEGRESKVVAFERAVVTATP